MILNNKSLLIILSFCLFAFNAPAQNKKSFTLIVDAGHGGHDPGTTGNKKYKKYEKDVALSIALKFGKLVEKNLKDVKVVYTRKTDVFIKLIDRPKIANDNNADLFVSIHCNANNKKSVNGSETYVLGTHKNKDNFNVAKKENSVIYLEKDYSVNYQGFDPNSVSSIVGLTIGQEQYLENSLVLASLIQSNFKTKTALRSRGTNGVKQAGFWVLARNYMPSVLVETGFLSNDKDAKYLMSEKGKNQVANALYLGFKEYKKYWDDQTGMNTNFVQVEEIEYAIQILSSKTEISTSNKTFKGLSKISYYIDKSTYKYIYNRSSDYDAVLSSRDDVKSKGFKGYFVIAFKNGERITLKDALKEDKNRK